MAAVDTLLKYLNSSNVAEFLDDDQLREIAEDVIVGYQVDDESRKHWLDINKQALKLIKTAEDDDATVQKDFPFPKASKVVYPLIGPAVIQLASRLITHLVRNNKVVECVVLGKDQPEIDPQTQQPTGQGIKEAKAKRISDFFSYELLVESDTWLTDMHKVCHILAAWGVAFQEVYYDKAKQEVCTEVISPEDVIINNNLSSLNNVRRITVRLYLTKNQIIEKIRAGQFLDIDLDNLSSTLVDNETYANDSRDKQPIYEFLKQTCYIDLDNDGYQEPYYVYVHNQSKKLFGIYPAYDLEDLMIDPKGKIQAIKFKCNLIDYHLIDDPEGKFYSLGLNHVLFHSARSITTLLRELIDAGNLANAAASSGFVTRAVKTRTRELKLKLGEFQPVDLSPDLKLSDQFSNLPFREPSQVLLGLFEALVQNAKETGFMTDILTGEAETQNVPATTTLAMVEQGTRAFKPVVQKLLQSEKKQFKLRFNLYAKYLDQDKYFRFQDQDIMITKSDFDNSLDVVPVADPTMSSEAHKYARLQALVQLLQLPVSNSLNIPQVLNTYLSGLDYPTPQLMIAPPKAEQPDPKILDIQLKQQIAAADAQNEQLKRQIDMLKAQLDARKVALQEAELGLTAQESQVSTAKIIADAHKDAVAMEHQSKQLSIQQFEALTERERTNILAKQSRNKDSSS